MPRGIWLNPPKPHKCANCPTILRNRDLRCEPCRATVRAASLQASQVRYRNKHRNRKRASMKKYRSTEKGRMNNRQCAARYKAAHRDQINARMRLWRKANPDKARAITQRALAKRRKRMAAARPANIVPTLAAWSAGGNAMLQMIAAAVPAGLPGRDDVCQSLALAMLEGEITTDTLTARVRQFVRGFYRDNHESAGRAVYMGEARRDGRSWNDVLASDASVYA